MGIHGIYKEIGPGERVALAKLAIQKFEETGRPLRIAIDTSIWLFQIQSGKGGTNPALRTFYYRLLRLMSHSIHPIFVFDGPNRPPMKRNKRTGPNVASVPEFLAKQLLKMFGYPIHLAPGEAEAECALLQKEGIVDAVMSEDVDTLMFGSGISLRNWSPEQTSSKTPTHVNLYDAAKTKAGASGLDREGMILVALMSGGDYAPEGIPRCGPKTACEAARAGFGRDLCRISRSDSAGMREWRNRLVHELHTNESKFFKQKHTTLVVPENFPPIDILTYYTHPVVSSQEGIARLKRSLRWDQDIDFPALRSFTGDAFDWIKLGGAKKFIRNIAPAFLVRELRLRGERGCSSSDDLGEVERQESHLITSIHGTRQHVSTGGTRELRVAFTPIDVIKIDLDAEEPDDEPIDDQSDLEEEGFPTTQVEAPKSKAPLYYDPMKPEKVWIYETIVKVGAPLKVQDWEEQQRAAAARLAAKASKTTAPKSRRTAKNAPAQPNTIQQYGKMSKSISATSTSQKKPLDIPIHDLTVRKSSPPSNTGLEVASIDLTNTSIEQDIGKAGTSRPRTSRSIAIAGQPSKHSKTVKGKREAQHVDLTATTLSGSVSSAPTASLQHENEARQNDLTSASSVCSRTRHMSNPPATPRRGRQRSLMEFLSPAETRVQHDLGLSTNQTSGTDHISLDPDSEPKAQPRRKRPLGRSQTDTALLTSSPHSTSPSPSRHHSPSRFSHPAFLDPIPGSPTLPLPPRQAATKSSKAASAMDVFEDGPTTAHKGGFESTSAIIIDSSPPAQPQIIEAERTTAVFDADDGTKLRKAPLCPQRREFGRARPVNESLLSKEGLKRKSEDKTHTVRLRKSLNGWYSIEDGNDDQLFEKQGKIFKNVKAIDLTGL